MASQYPSQRNPNQNLLLKINRSPGFHRFVEFIEDWLREGQLNVGDIVEEEEDSVTWRFGAANSFNAIISLYRDKEGEVFFWLEVAIARIDSPQQGAITDWLLRKNYEMFFPLRLALVKNIIVLQCRCYCDGITDQHFKLRLMTMIPYALEILQWLQEKFGLKSFIEGFER